MKNGDFDNAVVFYLLAIYLTNHHKYKLKISNIFHCQLKNGEISNAVGAIVQLKSKLRKSKIDHSKMLEYLNELQEMIYKERDSIGWKNWKQWKDFNERNNKSDKKEKKV